MKIRWENFLTGDDDKTVGRVTFLSRPREWHAVAVGAVAAVVFLLAQRYSFEAIRNLAVLYGGAGTARRMVRAFRGSGHVRDAMKEPAYAALGAVIGVVIVLVVLAAVSVFG